MMDLSVVRTHQHVALRELRDAYSNYYRVRLNF